MNAIHRGVGAVVAWREALKHLEKKKEKGAEVLEVVIVSALIAIAAVAVIAIIVGVINGWAAKIPT